MKKLISILLLLLIANTSYAQYLIIEGKTDPEEKFSKIYYTKKGEPFSDKKYIEPDLGGMYTFKAKIKDLKKNKTDILVFSTSMNASSSENFACTHKINIKNIFDSDLFKDQKSITIRNDFNIYRDCNESMYYEANNRGNGRFVGNYILTISDYSYNVSLENAMCKLSAAINPINKDYMTKLIGSWSYYEKENSLTLFVSYGSNEKFGTSIDIKESYRFIVTENEDGNMILTFEPKDGQVAKLEKL